MAKKKILFINQEISPYVPDNALSIMGRELPKTIQECSHEIRTFMPKWGIINERRGQLHEVIRLSGADHQGCLDTVGKGAGVFHRQRRLLRQATDRER